MNDNANNPFITDAKSAIGVALQGGLTMLALFAIFRWDILYLTALGSSCCAAFALKGALPTQTKHIMESYLIAIPIGIIASLLLKFFEIDYPSNWVFVAAALTVEATIFFSF